MYERTEIKKIIESYKVFCNTLAELIPDVDSNSIAQYGIKSSLPKVQGDNNSKVEQNVFKRDKVLTANKRLVDKINFVNMLHEKIRDDQNYCMLSLMKLGNDSKSIMYIMDIKKDEYFKRKKLLIEELYQLQFSNKID
ncbi:hypothetical protein [Staphylococcus xylosus]|uniref:hypothetical protein n=1 Tax=Staphylococcus xylosus TaxID=1288 RepID=UPI002DB5807D|nr:hypothetical protein [Staphylococcus xylosus]MEB6240149.1 hypothetical protein [Staphylococcus xylosus]MEB6244651.1 hypothetical protein [Staphylococcus xylosus]MEB7766066.1 hypothetical protein [Staphylococcus xylosus]